MNKKLQNKLYRKYPKIFRQKDLPMKETAMCWGFQCGNGWYWLIDNLCDSIQSYIDLNPHLKLKQVEANTVKEKYGGLRFYIDSGDAFIRGKISFAQQLSYQICEVCGTTKNVSQTIGWIYTLCDGCMSNEVNKVISKVRKEK